MEPTLAQRLEEYRGRGPLPFHMPGHKRNQDLAPYLGALSAGLDITEIPGFDDLHDPRGILKEAMERCAKLYGSRHSFFLVNGSTGGLLAGIRAATAPGDRVLVARNCHRAVYHALELCHLRPVFLLPPTIPGFGCAASLPPAMVEAALAKFPDIRLVILTSPTYEGVISDVGAICALAHGREIPVLVDEAHGAHLGLSADFPPGAVSLGADLVIQSFHKTLPSLTQTGVLHLNGDLVDSDAVARQLTIFQTSSPSYLLLASLEGCVSLLEERGQDLLRAWRERLRAFEKKTARLEHLGILGRAWLPGVFALDPGKIVIAPWGGGVTGVTLLERLAAEFHIQGEMALPAYVLCMTGMGDTREMMTALATALLRLDKEGRESTPPAETPLQIPPAAMSLQEGLSRPWVPVAIREAVGRLAAEYLWAYPPGIPLVIPGEVVTQALTRQLAVMEKAGVHLVGTRGQAPGFLAVLREDRD